MKFAVIATGGKQYLVQPEQQITVEKLVGEAGEAVSLTALAVFDAEGALEVGTPELKKGIPATIVKTAKDEKVIVVKYKNKTRYRRKIGHRQTLTTIKIGQIA
jgi:large subunit ribosomal protein L21